MLDYICFDLPVGSRQIEIKGTSFPQLAVDIHQTMMILHDPIHGGQPQPSAPSQLLGSKKRVKNPLYGLFIHANAGIRYRNLHIFPRV